MLSMLIEEAYVNNVVIEEAKRKNVKGLNKVNNVSKNEIKKRATEKMSKRYMPLEGNNFKAKNPGPTMQPGVPVGQPQSYNLPIPAYAGLPAVIQNSNNKNNLMPWILGGLGVAGAGGLGAAMLNNDQNELIDTVQNIVN